MSDAASAASAGAEAGSSPTRLRMADVIAMQAELLTALTTHTTPANARPSFKVSQVKGVGGALVIEWEVAVPVCDEYPTSTEAFKAACLFADDLRERFPTGTNGGE